MFAQATSDRHKPFSTQHNERITRLRVRQRQSTILNEQDVQVRALLLRNARHQRKSRRSNRIMVKEYCPHCSQPYVRDAHNTELYHQCNSGHASLDQDDITAISNSSFNPWLGVAARNFGRRSFSEGVNVDGKTPRGNRSTTHGQAQHFEHIDKNPEWK